jgi:hypothetical protein
MAEIRTLGLKSIKVGAVANDGGMGNSLSILGVTVQDTAELTQDDPEITNIYSEENDDPEEVIEIKGLRKLKWSIMNFDPDVIERVLGGTSDGDSWEAPDAQASIEASIEIVDARDYTIEIVRTKINAKLNMQFRKKNVGMIDIEAIVLKPTKTNTPSITFTPPVES